MHLSTRNVQACGIQYFDYPKINRNRKVATPDICLKKSKNLQC